MSYPTTLQKRLAFASQILAGLGFLFVVSWFLDVRFLLQLFPDLPGIKFNSAFLLLLAGICAWLYVSEKSPLGVKLLAWLIFGLAALSISQEFIGSNLGIDELVVIDSMGRAEGSLHPGRMPGMTSIVYLLFSSAMLFFSASPPKPLPGQILLHGISLLTFIGLTGYLMEVPDFYTLSFLTGISPSVALIWFVFSMVISLRHEKIGLTGLLAGEQKGSELARKITPRIALALILLTWIWIEIYRLDLIQVDFGITLFALSFLVVGLVLIWNAAAWLNRTDEMRRQAEQDLLLAKENLEKMVEIRNQELKGILDSAAVSIMATDKNGLIRHFSKGAERMLGYSAEEVVGKLMPEHFHVQEEIQAKAAQLSSEIGQTVEGPEVFTYSPMRGEVHSNEWSYRRKDGKTFPVQLNISQITSKEGKHLGFIGIATDITQLAESKLELKNLLDKLESKNKQLLNFAHIISHNLRSPVITLDSLIGFYKLEEDPTEKQELFDLLEEVVKNLLSSMEDTIDVLKVQEDSGQTVEEVSLEAIFDKTKTALIGKILETDAELEVNFSEISSLKHSRSYMESIFLNLMSNALKYKHPDRPPVLKIHSGIERGKPCLKFSDNGLGIDLDKHGDKVFGMNKTFHSNPDAKGVGLYIVKTQIESLGGKITVHSKPNEGTTFLIEFLN